MTRSLIEVQWTIQREASAEDQLTLQWREITGPMADAPDGLEMEKQLELAPDPLPEFSETLLNRIVPRMLDGTGRVEVEPSIFTYTLTCKLSALDDSREPSEDIVSESAGLQANGG